MSGKNQAPDPPDYTDLIAASTAAANKSFDLAKDQLDWAKEQYGKDREISDRVISAGLARQAENDAAATKDRQRYENVFQPQEDKLVADADSYASDGRRELEAGRAQASVAENFETSRRSAAQALESYGIDPSSTRYAALDAGSRIAQAAASAAAGNTARGEVDDKARSLRSEAIQVGQAYPGNVATTSSTSLQSGNQAVNSGLATTGSGGSTMGTAPQYQQLGTAGLNSTGDLMNNSYNNQLNQFNANQQSSSGLGAALGGIAGLVGNSSLASGAAGLGMFLEDGGPVPDHASPTAGKAIDDVPARLTAGEFVIPKDVLSWKGEEFFQKLIEGSRKAKPQAAAQPKVGAIPAEAPRFASRTAIPMGA